MGLSTGETSGEPATLEEAVANAEAHVAKAQRRQKREQAGEEARRAIDLKQLKAHLPELLALLQRKIDAGAQYKDAIEAIAGKVGLKKGTLAKFVKAKYDDKVAQAHAETAQLALLFENFES